MAQGMDRPFLHKSVAELDALFTRLRNDEEAMRLIADELERRHTHQAANLSERISTALFNLHLEKLAADSAEPVSGQQSGAPLPHAGSDDTPESLLSCWIAFEALTPQTWRQPEDLAHGNKNCVAKLSCEALPWEIPAKIKPKKKLFYQIALGSISMARATEALIRVFGDNEDEIKRPAAREKAAIAAIVVDANGIPTGNKGTAISSFAWALGFTLQRQLDVLASWPQRESEMVRKLEEFFYHYDDKGDLLPVSAEMISAAWAWLQQEFSLIPQMVEKPQFAVRIYQSVKIKTPPEASLLNSFFLRDLSQVLGLVKKGDIPVTLKQYLGLLKPQNIQNLITSQTALEKAIAPERMPTARWPAKGGHPLVLLQQAAVNLARSELRHQEGLLSVNGPPGTGKTTLLRDIIASVVTDRASAMVAFDDPSQAFHCTGHKFPANDRGSYLYALDPALKGHELLVASSNNKAVENVSKELPAADAVGRKDELRYFKSLSDAIFNRKPEGEENVTEKETLDTWGLIASVLGNSKNRYYFQQSFWWDEDFAFRHYLKFAKGDEKVVKEIRDPQTGKVIAQAEPLIIQTERPPRPQEARANWLQARAHFLSLQKEIDDELSALETLRENCLKLSQQQQRLAEIQLTASNLATKCLAADAQYRTLEQALIMRQSEAEILSNTLEMHALEKPFFLTMLFNGKKAKNWKNIRQHLLHDKNSHLAKQNEAQQARAAAKSNADAISRSYQQATQQLTEYQKICAGLADDIGLSRKRLDARIADDQFFMQKHEDLHKSSPWASPRLQQKREDLFIAAMAVHKAFIDASAQKVLHNLGIMMDVLAGKSLEDEAKQHYLGDLWSTLFLVIPVLSTTFSSVGTMLGQLPPGTLGWLLVDEAGQALPQAAVGALLRAKRAIVVGDPLQIPPVVSMPEKLISKISAFYHLDSIRWAAPLASVQTVTDHATRYQASFNSDKGPRHTGLPLLVHRRCQQPMFAISNHIAYDNQMVHAAGPVNPGVTGDILGESQWFDIKSDADEKWSPQEGEMVVSLLTRLAERGATNPDIFLITPFRQVAGELRSRLEREERLFEAFGVEADAWLKDRVGTIHTVQGREAESVILILGAPGQNHSGARNWAAGTPNILNVAASRAKQNLYVVGCREAWAGTGHAVTMANALAARTTKS